MVVVHDGTIFQRNLRRRLLHAGDATSPGWQLETVTHATSKHILVCVSAEAACHQTPTRLKNTKAASSLLLLLVRTVTAWSLLGYCWRLLNTVPAAVTDTEHEGRDGRANQSFVVRHYDCSTRTNLMGSARLVQ